MTRVSVGCAPVCPKLMPSGLKLRSGKYLNSFTTELLNGLGTAPQLG